MIWAAGSGPLALAAGTYALRVELVVGTHVRLDVVRFAYPDVAAEKTAWGVMKARFR